MGKTLYGIESTNGKIYVSDNKASLEQFVNKQSSFKSGRIDGAETIVVRHSFELLADKVYRSILSGDTKYFLVA